MREERSEATRAELTPHDRTEPSRDTAEGQGPFYRLAERMFAQGPSRSWVMCGWDPALLVPVSSKARWSGVVAGSGCASCIIVNLGES